MSAAVSRSVTIGPPYSAPACHAMGCTSSRPASFHPTPFLHALALTLSERPTLLQHPRLHAGTLIGSINLNKAPHPTLSHAGALNRVVDRGTRGISWVLSSMVFNVVPTLLEVGLVSTILAVKCGPPLAALTLGTIASYTVFTSAV